MKERLIEKRCNDRLEVWKQSDVSIKEEYTWVGIISLNKENICLKQLSQMI